MTNIQVTISKYLNGDINALPHQASEYVKQYVLSNTTFAWIWGITTAVLMLVVIGCSIWIQRQSKASDSYTDCTDYPGATILMGVSGLLLVFTFIATLICIHAAIAPLPSLTTW